MAGLSMDIGMTDYEDLFPLNDTNRSHLFSNLSDDYPDLPYHMTFNEDSVREVALYSLMFALAVTGNIPVFVALLRNRHRKSRVNLMILHLAIADLIVTFLMIPLEIAWRVTVTWTAGNAACKTMLFLRAFGPYLSSMVLVCISLDRYFAILYPLRLNDAQRRGKIMLSAAWVASALCSVPQSVIFHVENHPLYPHFTQCVSFHFFPTEYHHKAYNIFCLLAVYGVPLAVIVFCYSRILWEISKRSRDSDGDLGPSRIRRRPCLRRSDLAHIERARARTLRMTTIIVLTFFWCWTPYVVMTLWYLFDPVSADRVDSRVQTTLFMFAVSNSCVNPYVYGSYVLDHRALLARLFCRRRPADGPESETQLTTPRRHRMSVRLNGDGTYPSALVKERLLQPEQFRMSNSCNGICNGVRKSPDGGKVEVVVHSLDR